MFVAVVFSKRTPRSQFPRALHVQNVEMADGQSLWASEEVELEDMSGPRCRDGYPSVLRPNLENP